MMRNVTTRLGILLLYPVSRTIQPILAEQAFLSSIYLAGHRCILCTRFLVQLIVPISLARESDMMIIFQQSTFEPRASLQQQLPLLQYC